MASHERHAWLVIYDVANPRRLVRVAKVLERKAIRLQYSVFLGLWDSFAATEVLAEVQLEINPRKDDVRAYRLPTRCRAEVFGRAALPMDVVLTGSGLGALQLLEERGEDWMAEKVLEELEKSVVPRDDL